MTQSTLFPDNEQINAIKSHSAIWHYFFDNFKIMLLDEHIEDIIKIIKTNTTTFNNQSTSTDIP